MGFAGWMFAKACRASIYLCIVEHLLLPCMLLLYPCGAAAGSFHAPQGLCQSGQLTVIFQTCMHVCRFLVFCLGYYL